MWSKFKQKKRNNFNLIRIEQFVSVIIYLERIIVINFCRVAFVILITANLSLAQLGPEPVLQFGTRTEVLNKTFNGSISESLGSIPFQNEISVSCLVETPTGGFNNYLTASFLSVNAGNIELVDVTSSSPIGYNAQTEIDKVGRLVSFGVTYFNDIYSSNVPTGMASLIVDARAERVGMVQQPIYVTCYQNVLLGSYNTNGSPFSILELSNSSNGEVVVYLHARNSRGVKVIDGRKIIIPAKTENHTLLHDLVAANSYGNLTIEWIGGPNALSGRVSKYNPGGVTGFDYKGSIELKKNSN